ncbi:Methionine aminopeptidase [Dissulfuribacter thermophilus]|uniref:Methionine aminopeptidase n=1 Tax=Dissulfuribacter thermophilus TaxID=1156395 RepID=A0A1B9F544_9BACT|nr:type I methionyl aminopeptidase [Dissulfuribacter thermophilus]OCC15067.1 Methionine aminopeptidase [Dissulfuribacter thermophilus]
MRFKRKTSKGITLKAPWEIDRLRSANKIVAEVLHVLKNEAKPGITTEELDAIAHNRILKSGGKPAFLGYRGYPATTCISINNEVVHGIPSSKRVLNDGDLVSIDIGVIYKDYYGDAAISFIIGEGSERARNIIKVTEESLYRGIEKATARNRLHDISSAIQEYVEANGYNVVRKFVGHGIGRRLHEPPEVPNYGRPKQGPMLKVGMVLAIEPMVNEGTGDVIVLDDGWTAVTADGKLSAHFEHSVAILNNGPEILSRI